jgi:hypothetical protein
LGLLWGPTTAANGAFRALWRTITRLTDHLGKPDTLGGDLGR